jgi:trigger factor
MQVTETLAQGLRREYEVVVPAAELDAKVQERLGELKDRVQIRGFRPGKVPVEHLKRIYGRAVMAEAIEAAVQEVNSKIVTDNGFRLATQPKVTFPTADADVKQVVEGKSDLAYSVSLEVLPKVELSDFKGIAIEKLTTEVTDADIGQAVQRIADQNRPFAAKAEGSKAEGGDRVVVSFAGTIEGEPFEGGSGEDIAVQIGSNTFVPGFEDQLIGISAGETRTIEITFPPNYLKAELAGKDARFEVTAKSIESPGTIAIDDDFAKSLGMESLAKLRDAVKDRIQREDAAVGRRRLKRTLLDELDKIHRLDLPPTMVEEEFNNIWNSINDDLKRQGRTFADEGMTEEAALADYRKIAERRVRLGLVLAEIGDRNGIKVTDDELSRAAFERARQFPGQEKQVWEYYSKNPAALATLRAPIFEEKVIDYLVELAKVTEKKVPREELYKDDDAGQAEPAAS